MKINFSRILEKPLASLTAVELRLSLPFDCCFYFLKDANLYAYLPHVAQESRYVISIKLTSKNRKCNSSWKETYGNELEERTVIM